MITIDNKFEVGEECYVALDTSIVTLKDCPVCDGVGNIEYKGYSMTCGHCGGVGKRAKYDKPHYTPAKVKIKKIVITVKNNDIVTIYRTDCKTHNKKREYELCKTLEEAEEYCKTLEALSV